ncbi:hypothetical protein RclHR1_08080009 [Rhizophagus clarus]|uniref:Uncharacterized protein n=1 Tax=Rhizophagus clarus TaxID=94130 RepID=A0A2Z6SB03_9GLOM|nr:hypothetical protein RclHR1_08080009 [Rhizophagus clarus]GES80957.1 hypothetical protein GLOIN_2v1797743 [Rhizophagus clarus]
MTNIDIEIQAESSRNNILDNTQITCILDDRKMKMIMEKFKYCTEIKSNIATRHVEEVKELYEIFRNFIKDSLDFNIRLKKYSRSVLFFTECFNNDDDEILVLLRDLLKESKENSRLAKELVKRLFVEERNDGYLKKFIKFINKIFSDKRIMNELINTQNSLQVCIQDFKNEIASDEKALISYEDSVTVAVLLKLSVSLEPLDNVAGTNYHEKAKILAEYLKEEEKKELINQLHDKKIELNMINIFDKSLKSIIMGISDIKTFWEEQVEIIEYFIENLENFSGGENIQRRQIVRALEEKWKNVENECTSYGRTMKYILHNDYIR